MKRIKAMLFKACVCVFMALTLIFVNAPTVYAYVFNGYILSNPSNIHYCISISVGGFSTGMSNFVEIWEGYCPEVNFTQNSTWTGTENISIYGEVTVSNGAYASCYHTNNNHHTITIYNAYTQLNSVQQHETIVHEVGHALGLAHCQLIQNANSVMRESGFNNKPYPLSDDRAGITARYGS